MNIVGKTMTKSTITRERIQRIIRAINSEAYDEEEIREWLSSDEIMELSRMALSAYDSEPVAIVEPSDYVTAAQLVGEESLRKAVRELYEGALRIGDKLYRHAQQPTVAGDGRAEFETWMLKRWGRERRDDDFAMGKFIYGEDYADSYTRCVWKAWSASRAAMLASAPQSPGSEPATVPGKWIPVSEKLPERGDYLVSDGRDFDVQLFNGEQFIPGFVWEEKITHWMPLPAAPQEVKGE